MTSLILVFLVLSCTVYAEVDTFFWSDSVTSDWGRRRSTKRNLRGPHRVLSEMSSSISMSLPGEIDFPGSMSMPKTGEAGFEQFELDFSSSMSMSPTDTTRMEFDQFEEVNSISMSLPILGDGDFKQFGFEFDDLSSSMSMYVMGQQEFDHFEDEFNYSMSMSAPNNMGEDDFAQFQADFGASISLSMPWIAAPEFEHFESNFVSSLSMSVPNEPETLLEDTFFLMPLFDDRSDVMGPDILSDAAKRQLPISMSMPSEDPSEWTIEEDLEFSKMEEFSASLSLSMS